MLALQRLFPWEVQRKNIRKYGTALEKKKPACKPEMHSIYNILSASWGKIKRILQLNFKLNQYSKKSVYVDGDVESSVPCLLQRWQKFSHKSQFAFSLPAHCREAEEDINIYGGFSARMYQRNNEAQIRVLTRPLLPKGSRLNVSKKFACLFVITLQFLMHFKWKIAILVTLITTLTSYMMITKSVFDARCIILLFSECMCVCPALISEQADALQIISTFPN